MSYEARVVSYKEGIVRYEASVVSYKGVVVQCTMRPSIPTMRSF